MTANRGGMDGWKDGWKDAPKDGRTDVWKFPRVLQDIGPLGPLPKKVNSGI